MNKSFLESLRGVLGAILAPGQKKEEVKLRPWKAEGDIIPNADPEAETTDLIPNADIDVYYPNRWSGEQTYISPAPEVMTPEQVADMWDFGRQREEEYLKEREENRQRLDVPLFLAVLRSLMSDKKS